MLLTPQSDVKNCDTTKWRDADVVFTDQKPNVELKILPKHLEYAFLEEDQQNSVIIVADLAKHEMESRVEVLKK